MGLQQRIGIVGHGSLPLSLDVMNSLQRKVWVRAVYMYRFRAVGPGR